jgi:hypothetical protein
LSLGTASGSESLEKYSLLVNASSEELRVVPERGILGKNAILVNKLLVVAANEVPKAMASILRSPGMPSN